MSRVRITEYRAKKLILGDSYPGVSVMEPSAFAPKGKNRFVAKVDEGVKKRFKKGLVAVDESALGAQKAMSSWEQKGFGRFLVEPYLPHDEKEEKYLSLERVRNGVRVLFAEEGGIDIEARPESVKNLLIRSDEDVGAASKETGIPVEFLAKLFKTFQDDFFAFLEINPLIVRGKEAFLLDAAVLVDSAGAFFVRNSWGENDVVEPGGRYEAEEKVRALGKTTAASLKLNVVNPDGALFFLLSGGGGSIVIADEAALKGAGRLMGNYGEYSGGPTREETYLYAREIVSLMLGSKAKKKALVIAGGVANFTDVKETFAGIIDALSEKSPALKKAGIKVFVRRGGPNEAAGLEHMRSFLTKEGLLGSIYGSDAPITAAVDDAIGFLTA